MWLKKVLMAASLIQTRFGAESAKLWRVRQKRGLLRTAWVIIRLHRTSSLIYTISLFSQAFKIRIFQGLRGLYVSRPKKLSLTIWSHRYARCIFPSRFVWANGRAARIGRTIPVCPIGRLPILEALSSLPPDIWQSRQRFRNNMAGAANKKQVEEWSLLNGLLFLLSCANVRVFTFW